MKPFIFSMFMMLAGLQASAEDTTLHIKTQLEGVGDTLEVKIDDMLIPYIGSAGVFDFDFPLDEATYITIATPATFRGEELQYANLPAVPGETVEIKGSLTNGYTISGSRFYQDLNTIYNEIDQAMLPFNQLKMELNQQAAAGANQDSIMQIYNEREPEMQKQQDEALLDIVRRHADSEAVTVIAGQFENHVSKIQQAMSLMSREVREGRARALAYIPLEQAKMIQDNEEASARKQAAGVEAPDFTLMDINGKPLSLSSFRGKYVLLDFWGSWCTWCKEGFPKMRKQYKKYAGKFEIIGISCRDTDKDWRLTIKSYRLNWKHVFCPNDSDVLEKYGILGFPTKILINPEGKIVKSFVGEDPLYYSFIEAFFGE